MVAQKCRVSLIYQLRKITLRLPLTVIHMYRIRDALVALHGQNSVAIVLVDTVNTLVAPIGYVQIVFKNRDSMQVANLKTHVLLGSFDALG